MNNTTICIDITSFADVALMLLSMVGAFVMCVTVCFVLMEAYERATAWQKRQRTERWLAARGFARTGRSRY